MFENLSPTLLALVVVEAARRNCTEFQAACDLGLVDEDGEA
jgi:hypothetical protein